MEAPGSTKAPSLKKMNSMKDYNIVLLGQGGVGKSALLVRFSTGRFIHEYHPTLELNVSSECRMEFECTQRLYIEHRAGYGYNVTIYGMIPDVAGQFNCETSSVIDDEIAELKIFDTANTNEPHVYHNEYQGFLVVYSITDRMSFETAKQLVKLIREVKKMKTPGGITCVGLVGNKMDLKHERTVSRKEGTDFATEYECFLMETSALNNINVEQVFHDVVRQMRKSRSWKKKDKKTKNFFSR